MVISNKLKHYRINLMRQLKDMYTENTKLDKRN